MEMQKWEAQFVKRRLLIVNEELTLQKMAECTQMTDSINRGNVFKCQVVSGRVTPVYDVRTREKRFCCKQEQMPTNMNCFKLGTGTPFCAGCVLRVVVCVCVCVCVWA